MSCRSATDATEEQPRPVSEERTGYRIEYASSDRDAVRALLPAIDRGREAAEQFFGTAYPTSFLVMVLPDRASLTARWRVAWQQPTLQTQCWMIAAGWATEMDLLSPAAWRSQACGHDGQDAAHVSHIVAHELVHVLHGQRNPEYVTLATRAPWLTEGLATFASGQWAAEYSRAARAAVTAGFTPESFASIWASNANYAVAGSVFAYIHERFGPEAVRRALTARSETEFIASVSPDEPAFLRAWRAWLLTGP